MNVLHCSPTWADDLDRGRCVSLCESHFLFLLFVVLDRDDAFDYGGGRIPGTSSGVRPTRLYLVWPPTSQFLQKVKFAQKEKNHDSG